MADYWGSLDHVAQMLENIETNSVTEVDAKSFRIFLRTVFYVICGNLFDVQTELDKLAVRETELHPRWALRRSIYEAYLLCKNDVLLSSDSVPSLPNQAAKAYGSALASDPSP